MTAHHSTVRTCYLFQASHLQYFTVDNSFRVGMKVWQIEKVYHLYATNQPQLYWLGLNENVLPIPL